VDDDLRRGGRAGGGGRHRVPRTWRSAAAARWRCYRCDTPAAFVLYSSAGELAGYACSQHAGGLAGRPAAGPAPPG
jgi:hypothetical protein